MVALLLLLFASLPMRAGTPFALRSGDRVVFYGDEITAVQFYDNALEPRLYPTFVEAYVATRFPNFNVEFMDSAWNGDRVSGGAGGPIEVRLRRDVFAYKPTVMTIMLGMNDAWTTSFRPRDHEAFTTGYEMDIDPAAAVFDEKRFADYSSGYEHLVESVKDAIPGVRITVLTPSPYDDVTQASTGRNGVLLRYAECLDTMGNRYRLSVTDPNAALTAALRAAKAADPSVARSIIPDRMHPAAAGHLVIAEALLKTWNAPSLVSEIEIDARGRQVLRASNASVHDIKAGDTLAWTETDDALPFPLDLSDPALALVIRSSDFVQALDREDLKVDGLSAARYELIIDDDAVGTFDAQQLRAGINLALLDTPMKKQATRVFNLIQERENVHFGLWKRLAVPLQDLSFAHKREAFDALIALEKDLREVQHAAAQPRPHRYELRPAGVAASTRNGS